MPTHRYLDADGNQVPSVTTILKIIDKPGLLHWAYKRGVAAGREAGPAGVVGGLYDDSSAADAGTLAHGLIENRIRGRELTQGLGDVMGSLSEATVAQAYLAYDSFEFWREHSQFELVATEIAMVHDVLGFGGTVDAVARINGRLAIVDWKAAKSVYADYLPQVAAYARLWSEGRPNKGLPPTDFGSPIETVHVIRLGKEYASFGHHAFPKSVMDEAWPTFLAALELSRRMDTMRRIVG